MADLEARELDATLGTRSRDRITGPSTDLPSVVATPSGLPYNHPISTVDETCAMSRRTDSRERLQRAFLFSVPAVAVALLSTSAWLDPGSWAKAFSLGAGSSLLGASVVLLLERWIVGDPFEPYRNQLQLVADAFECGLRRFIVDRNSFFYGEGIVSFVQGAKHIVIQGTALNFLIRNERLRAELEARLRAGASVEVLISHPASAVLGMRDQEEGWQGTLPDTLKQVLYPLATLAERYTKRLKVTLFRGEIHNTLVVADDVILVNGYIFGAKGWSAPAFVLERSNAQVKHAYEGQVARAAAYASTRPGMAIPLESVQQLETIFSEVRAAELN